MHHPTRKYRIFKVTHIATGYFALIITISREYSLMAFVERINEQAKWGPDRKFTNYAFAYFVKKHAPVRNTEFTVELANKEEYAQQFKARSAAETIALSIGTDKLLNTKIVSNDKWELFNIGIQYFAGNGKKLSPLDKNVPTALERLGSVSAGTHHLNGRKSFDRRAALLWPIAGYSHVHLVTPDPTAAIVACIAADHAAWATVEVSLDVEEETAWGVGTTVVKKAIAFASFAPTLSAALDELQRRMEVIMARHTPQTVYKYE